jgi:hypothetical protein
MIYRPQFFSLSELVCPEVYNKFGEQAWLFLDDKAVITIDWIRRTLNKRITVNDWYENGQFSQRGLRCIQCRLIKDRCLVGDVYESPHLLGRGYDFDVEGMSADDVRVWLAINKEKLPDPIRLEKDVNWVHLDTFDMGVKVYLFNA